MIKPIHDRLLIRPLKSRDTTDTGLFIPEISQESRVQGEVIAAGPGTKDKPRIAEVGDKVLYNKYSGTPVLIEEKEYLLLRSIDVFAVME